VIRSARQPTSRPDLYEFILGSSPTIALHAADHFCGIDILVNNAGVGSEACATRA
jgi:NAD(P)-dependent dehydrogenase (short-subunit alcohol dehydrogenase family)